MAEFTEERTPYEFLVRWDENGNIRGAHVGWLDTVKKDGVILSQKPSNVESVSIADNSGYPLTDLLNQVQIDAFKQIDSINEQLGQKTTELGLVTEENTKLTGDLENKERTITELQQEIFRLNQELGQG